MKRVSDWTSTLRRALKAHSIVLTLSCMDWTAASAQQSLVTRDSIGIGVNGAIPAIVVDQFGYPTSAIKVAIIRSPRVGYDTFARYTPGEHFAVVDEAGGKIVLQRAPKPWGAGGIDAVSGDSAWWFDFSDVTTPGVYTVVDLDNRVRSYPFRIGDQVYKDVLRHAVRTFYYQRAGFEKTARTAGDAWADRASHLGKGQDSESRSWSDKGNASLARDLRGGWYDAGDYNKYTNWAARDVIVLLRAYDENPTAFGDDTNIAESGNGIPDILDEVKWALDWLVRMQNADGSFLCIQGLATGSPPSAATGPSYYGPPTTSASLMGAAAFAYAAKIYGKQRDGKLQAFAKSLAERAKKAWSWAEAHPSVTFFNNDEAKQPRSGGLGAGQQEMNEEQRTLARFQASVYLYGLTGEDIFKSAAEAVRNTIVPDFGPTQWDAEQQDTALYFVSLDGISESVRAETVERFMTGMARNQDQLPAVTQEKDPYRAHMKDYVWGSNQSKAAQSRLYELMSQRAQQPPLVAQARTAALDFLHYLHGANPLGLVYLSNMKGAGATHSVSTIYHVWFSSGSANWARTTLRTPGPAPGFLVGGPNPQFVVDACCSAPIGGKNYRCGFSKAYELCGMRLSPPLGQPPAKSYLQFNNDWPVGSWQITEPSMSYQSSYILALAPFAR